MASARDRSVPSRILFLTCCLLGLFASVLFSLRACPPSASTTFSLPSTEAEVIFRQVPAESPYWMSLGPFSLDTAMHYAKQYQPLGDKLRSHLPSCNTVVDIGAHIGLATFPLAAAGYKVIAVEPVPENSQRIRQSAWANGLQSEVRVIAGAAGSKAGHTEIFVPAGRSDNTALSAEAAIKNVGGSVEALKVKVVVVDEILDIQRTAPLEVCFMKVDVQGFEADVLLGASRLLRNGRPLVQAEFDLGLLQAAKQDPARIFRFMAELGYGAYPSSERSQELNWRNSLQGLPADVWFIKSVE